MIINALHMGKIQAPDSRITINQVVIDDRLVLIANVIDYLFAHWA